MTVEQIEQVGTGSVLRRAGVDSVAVILAYAPFGLTLGATLAATGVPALVAWSSSPLLFGGAAQLVSVQLLDAGAAFVVRWPRGVVARRVGDRMSARCVRVRELGPGEVDVLQAVFDGLSLTSRHYRFHGPVPTLTTFAKNRLSAVDGRTHLALVAYAGADPIGIARLVAIGDGAAELAFEVVDAWHRRGIGTCLVRAVLTRGRAVGFQRVAADVLAENRAAQALFRRVFDSVHTVVDGWELRLTAELSSLTGVEHRAA